MDTSFSDMNCELCHERPGHATADAFLCDVCEKIMDPDVMVFYSEQNKADQASLTARLGAAEKHVEVIRALREHDRQKIEALTAELAQARAERDAEQKRRVFAEEGQENLRLLKKLWENESMFYLKKSHDRFLTIERQRRTIRALVVAFRDALHLTRRVASDETWNMWLELVQRQAAERRQTEQSGQQAGE